MILDNKKIAISITRVKVIGIVFFLYTLGSFCVPMLGWNAAILQVPLYLFFCVCILSVKKSLLIRRYILWYAPFVLICVISSLYAPNMNDAVSMFQSLIMAFLFGLSITVFLSYEGALPYIKYSHIFVALYVGIQLIMNFQQKSWWSRLGESFGMNENMVALYFLIPFCFAVNDIHEKRFRIINILAITIFSYVIMLTGSKKALFAAAIYVVLQSILRAGRVTKKMRVLIISGALIVCVYNLLLRVELLYNIMGHRIEDMVNAFVMKDFSNSGGSTGERGNMILFGLSLFARSPIWGWGLNSFQELYGNATGHYAYAHNNYVELLADLGIIGFVWYYSLAGKIIKYILRLKNKLQINAFYVSLVVVLLFYDFAMVAYYDTRIIMLYMISFSGLYNAYRKGTESVPQ